MLYPFVPDLSSRILHQLNIDSSLITFENSLYWGILNPKNPLISPQPVMKKIEYIEDFT